MVLLSGKEEYLRSLHTERLVARLRDALGEVDSIRFDGAAAQPADILDECRSFDLMMRPKVVIVDDAEKVIKESSRALFERYCENPPESATLVLRSGAWRPGKLDKLIAKVGTIVKCEALSLSDATAWAAGRADRKHDADLAPPAARLLIERLGADLGRIDSELGKLAAAAAPKGGGRASIGIEHVRELVGRTREEEAWAVQSRLLEGPEEALSAIRDALGPWRQPPVMVMFACVDLARKIHGASRLLAQGQNPRQVSKELKLWGASTQAVLGAARRVAAPRAAHTLRTLVGLDRDSKTGVVRPEVAAELAALEFARLLSR